MTFRSEYRRARKSRSKPIGAAIHAGLYALALDRRKYGQPVNRFWWWAWLKWGRHVAN